MRRVAPATRSTKSALTRRPMAFLVVWLIAIIATVSCGGETAVDIGSGASAGQSASPDGSMAPEESMVPSGSEAPTTGPCELVELIREGLEGLGGVPLTLSNRVALEIELGKVQAAYSELSRSDLGPLVDQLEEPLRRLGYRLIDLEIAVEDFRTNSRPRPAGQHVETDAAAFGDAVAGFAILARC